MKVWITKHAMERYKERFFISFRFSSKNPEEEIKNLFDGAKKVKIRGRSFERKIPKGESYHPMQVFRNGDWIFFAVWSDEKKSLVITTVARGKLFGRKKRKR